MQRLDINGGKPGPTLERCNWAECGNAPRYAIIVRVWPVGNTLRHPYSACQFVMTAQICEQCRQTIQTTADVIGDADWENIVNDLVATKRPVPDRQSMTCEFVPLPKGGTQEIYNELAITIRIHETRHLN